jgi:hypothetical protein
MVRHIDDGHYLCVHRDHESASHDIALAEPAATASFKSEADTVDQA